MLVGNLASRLGVIDQLNDLITAANLPVAVLSAAKGDVPESVPQFAGLYCGAASTKRTRLAVEDTDVLITVGVLLADTVTGSGTDQLNSAGTAVLAAVPPGPPAAAPERPGWHV